MGGQPGEIARAVLHSHGLERKNARIAPHIFKERQQLYCGTAQREIDKSLIADERIFYVWISDEKIRRYRQRDGLDRSRLFQDLIHQRHELVCSSTAAQQGPACANVYRHRAYQWNAIRRVRQNEVDVVSPPTLGTECDRHQKFAKDDGIESFADCEETTCLVGGEIDQDMSEQIEVERRHVQPTTICKTMKERKCK